MLERQVRLLFIVFLVALALPGLAQAPDPADVVPVDGDFAKLDGIENKVMMDFDNVELGKIFEAIGHSAGFTIEVDKAIRSKIVTVKLSEIDAKTGLLRIAQGAGLEYEVVPPNKLIVRPRVGKRNVRS